MVKLLIKKGIRLEKNELDQVNQANKREFKAPPLTQKHLKKSLFFLLFDGKCLLAKGELIPIEPVNFNGERFSLLGIGGILATEKKKGYGKKIMAAIKKYLLLKDQTGVGFCGPYNASFYEKCGFRVNKNSIRQFVYYKDKKKILNKGDDYIVYLDSSDNFMKKVLSNTKKEVLLPRPPDW